VVATFLGSGQTDVFAEGVQQCRAVIEGKSVIPAIDTQLDVQKGIRI
jgi:hypothetical protein